MADHLVLVGMMGSGKSTVGRLVAASLGRPFVDIDDEVAATAGSSVADLFAGGGESAFRALEEEALARCLAAEADTVIAAGGGVVVREENRARLGAARVVWLRARPATLAVRVGDATSRPLLAGASGVDEAEARLAELAAERVGLYEAVADVVVDVDGLSADQAAARVLEAARP